MKKYLKANKNSYLLMFFSIIALVFMCEFRFSSNLLFANKNLDKTNMAYAQSTALTLDESEKIDINLCTVSLSTGDVTYTGEPQQKTVTLTYNGATLVENVDYTLEYFNNTKAGMATITITGIGNYEGTRDRYFEILKANAPVFQTENFTIPKNATRLSDIPLPENWEWVEPTKKIRGNSILAKAKYIGEDKDNYNELEITLNISIGPAFTKHNIWRTVVFIMIPVNIVFTIIFIPVKRRIRYKLKFQDQN